MPRKKSTNDIEHYIEHQINIMIEKQLKKININSIIMGMLTQQNQRDLQGLRNIGSFNNSQNQIINMLAAQVQKAILRNL